MRLEFEKWYEEKINNNEAKQLFNEACLCYKVGAYRASFLMTYLGFQNILKERLLKFNVSPNGIPENMWERIKNDLLDDKKWDETVFDSVNRVKPSNPFLIDDDIRKQYDYFRCIRNDCAHAKSNIISYPHVESLWLFIQSNNNKFIVNGGVEGLLERISIHYNHIYTKPGTDVTPIIDDITTSMKVIEIPSFLRKAYDLLVGEYGSFSSESHFDFWDKIVHSFNSDLRESIFMFVKNDWGIFLDFINTYPDTVLQILSNSSENFKREFWNDKIYSMDGWKYSNRWEIIKKLLENNIIPSDEVKDFIENLAGKYKAVPPQDYLEFFKSIGYLDEIKENIFGRDNFAYPNGIDYANYRWGTIKELITNIELDYKIVLQLNRVFLVASYGTFYSGMKNLLERNEDFRNSYKKVLIENKCTLPDCIS